MTTFLPDNLLDSEAAAVINFEIRQGSDWNDAIEFDLDATDFPTGLTGCTVDMSIRRILNPAGELILRVGTATADILIFGTGSNSLQFYVPWFRTTLLPAGTFTYVLRVWRGTERRTFATGRFTVLSTT